MVVPMTTMGAVAPESLSDDRCIAPASRVQPRPAMPAPLRSERPWSEVAIALAVFACALLYLWPLRDFLSFNADEGITLASAERILRGQVPYRDFFSFVTPLSPYLTALWFKVFGTSILVSRSILLIYAGLFGAMTYRMARLSCSRSAALFAAALVVFGCMPSRFFVLHNWDSTMLALLAICCALSLLNGPNHALSFFLGCTTALTVLAEQSKGAGLVLGLAIAAITLWLLGYLRNRVFGRDLWWCLAGFAIPVVLTFAYFESQHALKEMLEAWLWPLQHYSGVNRIAYGALPMTSEDLAGLYSSSSWGVRIFILMFSAPMLLISLLAILVIAATFCEIAAHRSGVRSQGQDIRVAGGCIFLGIFLSTVATARADLNHVIYLAPLFMYLVPSIFQTTYRGSRLFRNAGPIAAGLLLLSFLGFGLVSVTKALAPAARMESRRGSVRLAYPDEVLAYVQKNIPEGGHLYVHPYQASYSFMTATVNPARVNFLQAGMNTQTQYEMTVGDLARDRPSYVLLNPDFADKISTTWPATPAQALATDPVADYILQYYRNCHLLNAGSQRLWTFYAMVRNDLPCPQN